MSDISEAVQAGVAVATCLGGAIAFLWGKVERMNRRVKSDLEACEDARNTQLVVIEIFWRELERLAPKSKTLQRAGHLLAEMKTREELREAERGH